MKIAFFSAKPFEKEFFSSTDNDAYSITFFEEKMEPRHAYLSKGFDGVCCFVNDCVNAEVIQTLKQNGIKLIALRSAGFNHVDLEAATNAGITVVRVPAYSPYAVAEHAVALILSLNRKTHHAYMKIKENNFSLNNLLGFDLHGKTVGVIGTGKIGKIFANIMKGFGCHILAYDQYQDDTAPVTYVELDELLAKSDIISVHCPLTDETYHLLNKETISKMKDGVMLINVSRGALLDTQAAIDGLKTQKIGALGLDVYEEEANLFFNDLSGQVMQDDLFARIRSFSNVLITGHQAFFTREALQSIADTTKQNILSFITGKTQNVVEHVVEVISPDEIKDETLASASD